MPKILVVDDDPGLRLALKEALVSGGHSVIEAENGKEARNLIPLSEIDLIISDFKMPHLDGMELLEWVKSNHPCPFVLITAFSHLLETKEAFDKGADGFISKPFSHQKILNIVDDTLGLSKDTSENIRPEPSKVEIADEYCAIPIEDFVSSDGSHFNIYIKLSDDKYVRVAHKGDMVPTDRAENYKSKGLRHLYIKSEDMAKVVGFNLKVARTVTRSPSIPREKKLNFMRYTVETVLENVRVNGVSSESFDQVKSCVNTSLALISESDSVFSVLDSLNSHSNWIYAHSLGVGTYSVMTAKKMGWKSPATSFKLFTAGLLHDIGKKEISTEILNKPRHLLSQEERKYIETHPIRGKEILSEIKEIPGDIIQIVYEHHEDCLGNGYPRQIKKQYIHPLAKVVSVANHFCKHALKTPHSKGLDFAGTLNTLESEYRGRLDYSALKALSFCGTV